MNIKVGNERIVAGDYRTYNGIRVGFLRRHTYNGVFLDFVKEKGFDCDIIYYETPTELSNALVNDEVDALVNSYIRIPEDEQTIENFGETPYYIMARKEDQALIDRLLKSGPERVLMRRLQRYSVNISLNDAGALLQKGVIAATPREGFYYQTLPELYSPKFGLNLDFAADNAANVFIGL